MTAKTTHRAILAGAASLPALAMPAVAGTHADPIFAQIEMHRIASVALNAVIDAKIKFERSYIAYNGKLIGCPDKFDHAEGEASTIESDAMWNVISMIPTTMAGLAAMLAYVREMEDRGDAVYSRNIEWGAMLTSTIEHTVAAWAGLPEPASPKMLQDTEAA